MASIRNLVVSIRRLRGATNISAALHHDRDRPITRRPGHYLTTLARSWEDLVRHHDPSVDPARHILR
jgi:hypothetical protein